MSNLKRFGIVAAVIVGIIAIILLLTQQEQTKNDKLSVTATYYPLYDFAKQVGGDKINIQNVTPAGSEPHDFEPSPRQIADAQTSDVFIYNGTGLEPWVDNFLKSDYRNETVTASHGIELIEGGEEHSHDEEETDSHKDEEHHDHEHDPHFWLDPVYAQRIVDNIARKFAKVQPEHADYFNDRANEYNKQLVQLDADYKSALQTCQTRNVITSHEAFGYIESRYNLSMTAIAGLSPDEEPSAAKLAEIVSLVKQENIQYIFFESLVSPRLADTIARETGAKTAVLDPIEGITDDEQEKGANYLSVQRQNLQNLRTALACS